MSIFVLCSCLFLSVVLVSIAFLYSPHHYNSFYSIPSFVYSDSQKIKKQKKDKNFKELSSLKIVFSLMVIVSSCLFYLSFLMFSVNLSLGLFLFMWSLCSSILSTTDFLFYLLPNKIIFLFLCLSFSYFLFFDSLSLRYNIVSGLVIFSVFYFLFLLFPNGIGGGDVKLAGLIGLSFGYQRSLSAFLIASILALLYGVLQSKHKNKKQISSLALPFGPFLFAGTWIVLLREIFN